MQATAAQAVYIYWKREKRRLHQSVISSRKTVVNDIDGNLMWLEVILVNI